MLQHASLWHKTGARFPQKQASGRLGLHLTLAPEVEERAARELQSSSGFKRSEELTICLDFKDTADEKRSLKIRGSVQPFIYKRFTSLVCINNSTSSSLFFYSEFQTLTKDYARKQCSSTVLNRLSYSG